MFVMGIPEGTADLWALVSWRRFMMQHLISAQLLIQHMKLEYYGPFGQHFLRARLGLCNSLRKRWLVSLHGKWFLQRIPSR